MAASPPKFLNRLDMIAKPRVAYYAAEPTTIKTVPSDTWPAEIFLECEIESPPSMAGRTVHVRIPQEQIPAILRDLRTTAISARSAPMA